MKSFNIINYNIFLDIDITNLKYSGKTEIKLVIEHEINELEINCKDIEIKSLKLDNNDTIYNYNKKNNVIIIKENFIKKEYIIKIEFDNIISDDLEGIYYTKEDGETIICTQLEPDLARRVFPCFDNPDYKSTFDISIKINNKNYHCLSNMELLNKTNLLENNLFTFKT
jgi:tricorn protease interacting factor F2/3